jgi:hypothetical protein
MKLLLSPRLSEFMQHNCWLLSSMVMKIAQFSSFSIFTISQVLSISRRGRLQRYLLLMGMVDQWLRFVSGVLPMAISSYFRGKA